MVTAVLQWTDFSDQLSSMLTSRNALTDDQKKNTQWETGCCMFEFYSNWKPQGVNNMNGLWS